MRTNFWGVILFAVLFLSVFCIEKSNAQCIVINEVLSNASGSCDGACNPSTSEWTELYNTCNYPVDISCYILTNGRFSATIPNPTIIPAHGFYVIGSSNSPGPVNLDIGACGCTTGSLIGTYTNGADQAILADNTGKIQSAVDWGGGARFPLNITSSGTGGCTPVTISISSPANFESVPSTSSSDGCTVGRTCDGSSTWVKNCGGAITMGLSNTTPPFPDFFTPDTVICTGTCISFTDKTTGNPTAWTWTFAGSSTPSYGSNAPSNICYPDTGKFDVSLAIKSACGNFSVTKSAYIKVSSGQIPLITATGPTTFCPGSSVVLQTSSTGTYQWNLDGNPINGATNQQYTANAAGAYTLKLTTGSCSGTSVPITVIISNGAAPAITAGGSTTFCSGGSVTLNTGSTGIYQWNLNGNTISGATDNQYTATAAGDYTLTLTSGTCSGTSTPITVFITLLPNPQIMPQGPTSLCNGGSVVLDAGTGLATYQWGLNGALIPGATNETYTATGVGNYQVLVVNSGGCADTSARIAVTTLSVNPTVITSSTGSFTTCSGQSLTLSIGNSYAAYQWYQNNSIIPGATNDNYPTSAAGNYSVDVTTSNSCTGSSSQVTITITQPPVPSVTPSGNVPPACGSNSITIQSGSAQTYQWLLNNSPISGANSNTYQTSASGDYAVIVSNGIGCSATSTSTTITFFPTPSVKINTSGNNLCEGDTITLSLDNGNYAAISWSTAEDSPSIKVTNTDEYSVTVTDANGCSASDAINITFNPPPTVDAGPDITADCTTGTILKAGGTGNFSWKPVLGLSDPAALQPIAKPTTTTTYTITVSNGACNTSDEVIVSVDCDFIVFPNAFSPNNDGNNDVFKVMGKNIDQFDMKIFNRWGEMVFESTNPEIGWDGTYKNQPEDVGIYVWQVTATSTQGTKLLYNGRNSGNVTLLR